LWTFKSELSIFLLKEMVKPKHILYAFLGLSFIFGYNYWLVQRDQKLFDAYGQTHPLCTEYTFQKECNE
jgi:hypothetical protein